MVLSRAALPCHLQQGDHKSLMYPDTDICQQAMLGGVHWSLHANMHCERWPLASSNLCLPFNVPQQV